MLQNAAFEKKWQASYQFGVTLALVGLGLTELRASFAHFTPKSTDARTLIR